MAARTDVGPFDLSATAIVGQTDVRDCTSFSVWLQGVTGGGSVTIEGSIDGGTTWIAIGTAKTTDGVTTITDLYDYVRLNVGTGKASAKGFIKRLVQVFV